MKIISILFYLELMYFNVHTYVGFLFLIVALNLLDYAVKNRHRYGF